MKPFKLSTLQRVGLEKLDGLDATSIADWTVAEFDRICHLDTAYGGYVSNLEEALYVIAQNN